MSRTHFPKTPMVGRSRLRLPNFARIRPNLNPLRPIWETLDRVWPQISGIWADFGRMWCDFDRAQLGFADFAPESGKSKRILQIIGRSRLVRSDFFASSATLGNHNHSGDALTNMTQSQVGCVARICHVAPRMRGGCGLAGDDGRWRPGPRKAVCPRMFLPLCIVRLASLRHMVSVRSSLGVCLGRCSRWEQSFIRAGHPPEYGRPVLAVGRDPILPARTSADYGGPGSDRDLQNRASRPEP